MQNICKYLIREKIMLIIIFRIIKFNNLNERWRKKNCSSNRIFTLIKEKELITIFNNEQTFNTTSSKFNFSENEFSHTSEFHSEKV